MFRFAAAAACRATVASTRCFQGQQVNNLSPLPLLQPMMMRSFSNDKVDQSLNKNPIVQQLWKARQDAKDRSGRSDDYNNTGPPTPKTPSESRVEVSYPFATDLALLETYRNPWGQMRIGRVMEDLDALAGNIAFFHVDQGQVQHPVIVTASFDRIAIQQRPQVDIDQHLSGQVTWTGTSSMEIRMQCHAHGSITPWLEAYVTFVTLDPNTNKPMAIAQVLPETNEEKQAFEAGAQRAAAKKEKRKRKRGEAASEENQALDKLANELLEQASPLLSMPSLADPHSILLQQTRMQNAMIAQPQVQNLHSRIFGGFLMRRAFELAYANAYVFGGARPVFLEVDEVSFTSPVDVGDLLVFNSCVLTTEHQVSLCSYYDNCFDADELGGDPVIVTIEVETWVTEPETVQSHLSNQFYFTFAIVSDKPVRKVLPGNIGEARRMAIRRIKK